MKKKTMAKLLAMSLAAAIFATSIPTNMLAVKAAETEETEVSVIETDETSDYDEDTQIEETNIAETEDPVSDNSADVQEEEKETEEPTETEDPTDHYAVSDLDLFSLDFKTASDDTINEYLRSNDDKVVAAWISSLSDSDKSDLLERDTDLNKTLDYYGSDDSYLGLFDGQHFDTAMEYYELLATDDRLNETCFAKTSGYITIKFTGLNAGESIVKVSSIDTSIPITTRQSALNYTVSAAKNGLVINADSKYTWYINSNKDKIDAALRDCTTNGPSAQTYTNSYIGLGFTKPVGYAVSAPQYSNFSTSTPYHLYTGFQECTYTYNGKTRSGIALATTALGGNSSYTTSNNISFRIISGLTSNWGVGKTSDGGAGRCNEIITFNFTPATYYVDYNSNGGSAVGSQTCYYGVAYNSQGAPATAPTFTATFDNASPVSGARAFGGWQGLPASFANLTTVNGQHLAYTAAWGNASVTMPAPNTRTINAFTVKYDTQGKATTPADQTTTRTWQCWEWPNVAFLNAGQAIEIGSNITVNSVWSGSSAVTLPNITPVQYTVSFDSNGGSSVASKTTNRTFTGWDGAGAAGASYTPSSDVTLNAVYSNEAITLPSATKTGYKLSHWTNGAQTYAVNSAYTPTSNTTLTAQWDANNYTIKLDPNTGALPNEVSDTVSATYDQTATLPIPSKTGYVFKGWKSDTALYAPVEGVVEVTNLSENDGDTITLIAEWEAGNTSYTVNIYEYNKNTKTYDFKESYTESAIADSQITVPAKDRTGFATPSSQLVTVNADGSTVVEFKYDPVQDIVIPGFPDNIDVDTTDIIKRLESIETIVSLTKSDWDSLRTVIASMTTLSQDMTEKLIDVIKNSSSLTEQDKKDILKAFAEGYISDELKAKLIKAIESSNLSQEEKESLISSIKSLSNLSVEEQVKIRELLEKGSSVSYTINGIEYEIYKNADGTLSILLKGLNNEKNVVIPDAVTVAGKTYAVTEISKEAFKNNSVIETVKLGNNITNIGTSAFEGCKNLKSVTIGPNVKEIGSKAFKGCTSLTKISIPSSVLKIGTSAFENCTKLKTVTLHDGLLQIGTKAFYNCRALTKIKIPKTVLKIKSYAFGKCVKMKTLTFAAGSNLTTLSEGVFSNCKILEKVVLPEKLTAIPKKTFTNDVKLKSCTGGAKVTRIGEKAFQNCTALKKFTVQTKVQTIGERAFYGCKKLSLITIKSNALTGIGDNAAKKCHKSLKIKCPTKKKTSYAKLWKGKY